MTGSFERVEPLLENLEDCLRAFEKYSAFSGHPAESHRHTLSLVRKAAHPTAVLDMPDWYASLYTTLQDWNMDMRRAVLLDPEIIRASFIALRGELAELEDTRLEAITAYRAVVTEKRLWNIISRLKVGEQETRLVVNTKALHHLLPDLVPPMDRTYTVWFFYDNPAVISHSNEKRIFSEVWPQMVQIAHAVAPLAPHYLGRGMHTSIPKMVDNAIIGYRHLHDHNSPAASV